VGDSEPQGSAAATEGAEEPGQAYNPGAPTPPRQAASVIVLRSALPPAATVAAGAAGELAALEVLLVRRTPRARFMGGVWVFPGGAVDAHEGASSDAQDDAHAHRLAAIRELREEAGVELDGPAALVPFSRWITPAQVQIRFDTRFFLAELPSGQEPRVDGEECVDLGWFAPREALERSRAGELELVFPTIKHLEQLGEFATVAELLAYARGRAVEPVEPRVVLEGEVARILLPGEEGY